METTPHIHLCTCGCAWVCQKSDCFAGDGCQRCEDDALTTYLDKRVKPRKEKT